MGWPAGGVTWGNTGEGNIWKNTRNREGHQCFPQNQTLIEAVAVQLGMPLSIDPRLPPAQSANFWFRAELT